MQTLRESIRRSVWAEALTGAQLERVLHDSFERSVDAGTVVGGVGEAVDHWIGIIEGLVKLTAWSPEGRSSILVGYTDGGWFGEGSLLRTMPRQYEVIALRKTRIAFVPRQVFEWLIETSLPFCRFVAAQLNDRLADFIVRMEHERFSPLDRYIAYCLASLFDPRLHPRARTRIEMSQSDVGQLTGRSRQQVNSALQQLEKSGLIQRGYHSVTVTDVARLREYGLQRSATARDG